MSKLKLAEGLIRIASVTVHNGASMTPRERKEIAAWLRKVASEVELEGHEFSKRWRAGFFVRPKRKTWGSP